MLHNSLKERVLQAIEIVELIGERVALTRKRRDFVGLCPFHNDHKPSMSVSPAKQIFKCWACGAGGDAIRFVQLAHRVEFREALTMLARRAGINADGDSRSDTHAREREELRRILEWAQRCFAENLASPVGESARRYAVSRGLTAASLADFRIGLALDDWTALLRSAERAGLSRERLAAAGLTATSDSNRAYDRFRNRLIFPIADPTGRCVAFGGRTLGDDPAKYLNSPESALFSKSRVLYGFDRARAAIASSREAIVVEGYLDAVLMHQFGFRNTVATLGTALTEAHVRLLRPLADVVFLCFDSDDAGLRAADRAIETGLRGGVEVRVAVAPGGKDPAECLLTIGPDGFRANLHSARDALEFKWKGIATRLAGSRPAEFRAAVGDFVRFVARVAAAGRLSPVAQGQLVSRLSDLLSQPANRIYELLTAVKAGPRPEAVLTPDTSESSAYAASIRGLPSGLVTAVEEVVGLLLSDPGGFAQAESSFRAASGFSAAWGGMYERMAQQALGAAPPSRAALIESCDDAALSEMVSLACVRVSGTSDLGAALRDACARLSGELDLLRAEALRATLGGAVSERTDRVEALRGLVRIGRASGGFLPVARRGGVTGAGS